MQQIKLRVYEPSTKRMYRVYSMSIDPIKGTAPQVYCVFDPNPIIAQVNDPTNIILVQSPYLMMGTGCLDADGKEIYEGDVLRHNKTKIDGYVGYEDGRFIVRQISENVKDEFSIDFLSWDEFDVINNIFDAGIVKFKGKREVEAIERNG